MRHAPSTRMSAMLAAAALAAGLLTATVVAAAPVRADGTAWSVTDRLALDQFELAAACDSSTDCWSVTGGILLERTDGGGGWIDRTHIVPATVRGLFDASCPTTTRCFFSGFTPAGATVVVVDGSTTATARPVTGLAAGSDAPVAISCSTDLQCVATNGTAAFRTADAGATWLRQDLPSPVGSAAVSCVPGGTVCVVVGAARAHPTVPVAARTRDGGATWEPLLLPSQYAQDTRLSDVSCFSGSVCRMVGDTVRLRNQRRGLMLTTTSDTSPDTAEVDLPANLARVPTVACTNSTRCTAYAVGTEGSGRDLTTTDGTHWSSVRIAAPRSPFDRVDMACGVAGRCVVADLGQVQGRALDRSWRTTIVPAAINVIEHLSCVDGPHCVGTGSDAAGRPVLLRGRPGAWSVALATAWPDTNAKVSCASATVCTTLGGRAEGVSAWRSEDGGVTWALQPFPASVTGVGLALDCPTPSTCLALTDFDGELVRTVDGGTTWTEVSPPGHVDFVATLSCGSSSDCVVAGGQQLRSLAAFWRTRNVGSTFSPPIPFGRKPGSIDGITCEGTVCLARDGIDIVRSTDGGRTWAVTVTAVTDPDRVSVPFCGAGGRCAVYQEPRGGSLEPVVSSDGGATWAAESTPAGFVPLADACTATGCLSFGWDEESLPIVVAQRA